MDQLCGVVSGLNPIHIAVATIAQHLLSLAWFEGVVKHLDRYYMAADKGVRRIEYAVHRYPAALVTAICMTCSALRAAVVLSIVNLFKGTTFCDYQYAALATALLSMISIHRKFACQRPIQLIIIEAICELSAAMLVSVISYTLKQYGL